MIVAEPAGSIAVASPNVFVIAPSGYRDHPRRSSSSRRAGGLGTTRSRQT
ncbi:hypothetical protein AKJ09_02325 [Labilithrix luteola]|uniref:Uncharacterized protein n=1 Tax=Labilithrix luteola TaxID=1391654 RepID=A0A0K1PQJ6_9BACT|nr:hypothetical protein AKJ09_02325 [Labilithrix luteola]